MSNQIKGAVVVFNADINEVTAQYILDAIKMIKGVQCVEQNVLNSDDYINRMRIINEVRTNLYKIAEELK